MAGQQQERMLFVCGACATYWSAVATVQLGPGVDAKLMLDSQAALLKSNKPRCPRCDAAPPLWSFERHPVLPGESVPPVSGARQVDLVRRGVLLPGSLSVAESDASRVQRLLSERRQLRRQVCDHKFIDSRRCVKCGWAP